VDLFAFIVNDVLFAAGFLINRSLEQRVAEVLTLLQRDAE